MGKVLDHGFVELVDSIGNDLSIVNAARVSFNKSSARLTKRDEGLINFLMKNKHGTPFEMVDFTFRVKCPIFVAREWFRHRIACVTGDTLINCLQPNGVTYKRSIEHLYTTYHGKELPDRWRKNGFNKKTNKPARIFKPKTKYRTWKGPRVLKVLNENNEFTSGIMKDIWEVGIKEIYQIKTKDGKILKASSDHRVLTPDGWAKVNDLSKTDAVMRMGRIKAQQISSLPPALRQGIGVWTTMQRPYIIGQGEKCYVCNNFYWSDELEIDHVIPVYKDLTKALDLTNLAPICKSCHREKINEEQPKYKRTKIGPRIDRLESKPIKISEELTYDIEMDGINHNYLANDIIVHNSYNEMSGRYVELKPEFYIPSVENVREQKGKPGAYYYEPTAINTATIALNRIESVYIDAWKTYQQLLQDGIAKEQARIVLPVGIYTEFIFKINLRSLFNFLSLRNHDHAMYEIREYAKEIEEIIKPIVPITIKAFEQHNRITP